MENHEPVLIASVSSSRRLEMADRAGSLGGPVADPLVSCSLKRKRPPKIEIPNILREIPSDVFKECIPQGQGGGPVFFTDAGSVFFSLKGKKKFMEDAYKVSTSSNGNKRFFGVYDGHGGSKTAEFVAENLHLKIFETLESTSEI